LGVARGGWGGFGGGVEEGALVVVAGWKALGRSGV
jgi:hypothetical protein